MERSTQVESGLQAGTERCPNCGALNPLEAEWCSLCLTRFEDPHPQVQPEPEPEPEPEPAMTAPVVAPGVPDPLDPATPLWAAEHSAGEGAAIPPEAVGTERGAFKVTEEGIRWTCGTCETENPIESTFCSACGAPIAATVVPSAKKRVEGDPGTAALLSMAFAGAGHGYLKLWGQAIARGVVQLWILLTVVAGFSQADNGGRGGIVAAIFSLVALGFTMVAAHDAYREARHEANQTILKGRMFLYVVLALLMLLMTLLVVTGLQARG